MSALPHLRFIEQHDPFDLHTKSQPYAYVADVVHEVKLSTDIDDIRGRGVSNDQWAALVDLRDQLCKDQKVAWYVVVCGDEERWAPSLEETRAQKRERDPHVVTRMYGNGMGSPMGINGNGKGSVNSRDRSDSEFTMGSGSNSTEVCGMMIGARQFNVRICVVSIANSYSSNGPQRQIVSSSGLAVVRAG